MILSAAMDREKTLYIKLTLLLLCRQLCLISVTIPGLSVQFDMDPFIRMYSMCMPIRPTFGNYAYACVH